MAPLVPRKGARAGGAGEAIARLAGAQAEMLRNSEWVGDRFAETARAMHLGEIAESAVHGEATRDEAKSLIEDGVPIAPLAAAGRSAEPSELINADPDLIRRLGMAP